VELVRIDQLVGEPHDVEHERIVDDFDPGEMLRRAQDDLPDADRFRLAQDVAQQRVRLVAPFLRHQIIRRLEVARIDLVLQHEVENVDGRRRFERGLLEVVFGHHDELPLLVLVPFDDVVPRERPRPLAAEALVLHGRQIFFIQQPKGDVVRPHGRP